MNAKIHMNQLLVKTVLEVRDLSVSYGKVEALSNANIRVGEGQIVYASDYLHWDHSFPGSIGEIRDRGDLADAQKGKILADNARRLYRL